MVPGVEVGAVNRVTRARKAIVAAINDSAIKTRLGVHAFHVIPDGGAALPVAFLELDVERPRKTRAVDSELEFLLIVLVSTSDSERAQELIDELVAGATSVRQVIEKDRTLNGAVTDIAVSESRARGQLQLGGIDGWAREWRIRAQVTDHDIKE